MVGRRWGPCGVVFPKMGFSDINYNHYTRASVEPPLPMCGGGGGGIYSESFTREARFQRDGTDALSRNTGFKMSAMRRRGSGVCPHKHQKSTCKECGGGPRKSRFNEKSNQNHNISCPRTQGAQHSLDNSTFFLLAQQLWKGNGPGSSAAATTAVFASSVRSASLSLTITVISLRLAILAHKDSTA